MSTKIAYEETTQSQPDSQDENEYTRNAVKLSDHAADESYKLFSKVQVSDPTPEEARRIRNKCLWRILPFLCIGYHLMGGITLLHIPCNNFASLFVVRFLLGLSEACIVPAFLLSMSMFFTYQEQAVMMSVMWSIGNSSPITSGFLSYGVLWIKTGDFHPWKWLMVITGVITIIFGVLLYFFFPDSPLHANFLTYEERAQAILRIKGNNSGIEQKKFKKHQFIEAIKDPKTWLFALHAWSQEMGNGINNQSSLIINSFGFTVFQTTLLSTVTGVIAFFTLSAAAIALHKTQNSRAWISLVALHEYLTIIIYIALPWSNRWGLIVGVWLRYTTGVPYAVVMIWAANASAGHTKKTTVIALYHIGYGLGNIISPQLFEPRWKPRYKPTWIILLIVAAILPSVIIIILRIYLSRENKRRDKLEEDNHVADNGLVETTNADGRKEVHVVDTNQLDLTDRENLKFRYVL
ncbi:major facilitator superfamily domain, general substrate transporter [Trichoderma arundinaceum]|uniref:Major facilitator superfamily domain, general substrate transporter n=1 Tax=Trichoderma arundinaceum TaxID=490622 RepID=A0A395NTK9_TRIAR|nr:major facilitator superfamily domain, general substrate transporter [Trichoderma arundinaceum]